MFVETELITYDATEKKMDWSDHYNRATVYIFTGGLVCATLIANHNTRRVDLINIDLWELR